MEKSIIKFGDIEIEKKKKKITNIKGLFQKNPKQNKTKHRYYSLATEMLKYLDLYVYFFQN